MSTPLNKLASHILKIDGEEFPVYHQERRLYKFVDWQDARNKLIKLMLAKIKARTNESTAFINFKMANPMRKTRLGNFFIDISAEIMLHGKQLELPEDLDLSKLFVDSYITLDDSEIQQRAVVEEEHSSQQYKQELETRIKSLSTMKVELPDNEKFFVDENLEEVAENLMLKDGWSKTQDNRIHARHKRIHSLQLA